MDHSDQTEELLQKHRKEKKELQAKIQALKKTITKGDKKKKREVGDEIAKLESELDKRHSEELTSMNANIANVGEVVEEIGDMKLSNSEDHGGVGGGRVSKAQRRRERKASEAVERELRIAEQEAQDVHGARSVETKDITAILKAKGLMINDIPSDGDCLYRAVCEQLEQNGVEVGVSVSDLRGRAGEVLRKNRSEFLPFLSHPDTGEILTEDQYAEYCNQVAETSAWGGHVELLALAKALQCRIEVIQAKGPVVSVGREGPLLTLTYHRHMYGLGEHYNSVKPFQEEPVQS